MKSNSPHDPPFRADHVGSLLRPAELLKARTDRAAGRISVEELRAIEDSSIRDAVAFQESVGLQSITDGEYRREIFYSDFYFRGLGGGTVAYDPSSSIARVISFLFWFRECRRGCAGMLLSTWTTSTFFVRQRL